MPLEIERKFLVVSDMWRPHATAKRFLVQFYLSTGTRSSVRVRLEGTDLAWLTIKAASHGRSRLELEYPIPVHDARQMMVLAEGAIIEKVRHLVPHEGLVWEVDVFSGDNEGLTIAEVELERADQPIHLPAWLGREVTDDRRYYNASLAHEPLGHRKRATEPNGPPAAHKA